MFHIKWLESLQKKNGYMTMKAPCEHLLTYTNCCHKSVFSSSPKPIPISILFYSMVDQWLSYTKWLLYTKYIIYALTISLLSLLCVQSRLNFSRHCFFLITKVDRNYHVAQVAFFPFGREKIACFGIMFVLLMLSV